MATTDFLCCALCAGKKQYLCMFRHMPPTFHCIHTITMFTVIYTQVIHMMRNGLDMRMRGSHACIHIRRFMLSHVNDAPVCIYIARYIYILCFWTISRVSEDTRRNVDADDEWHMVDDDDDGKAFESKSMFGDCQRWQTTTTTTSSDIYALAWISHRFIENEEAKTDFWCDRSLVCFWRQVFWKGDEKGWWINRESFDE